MNYLLELINRMVGDEQLTRMLCCSIKSWACWALVMGAA